MHAIDAIYRAEAPRVRATLLRLLGDLDQADEALQEAFAIALERWPREGLPENPRAWLVSVARFKTIDRWRREARGQELLAELGRSDPDQQPGRSAAPIAAEEHLIQDDQLRLIFYCCHPELGLAARIALALREVCGLSFGEIARAYLTSEDAIQKRIQRAKARIRERQLSYELPDRKAIGPRLSAVLHVIYLIYNEGFAASSGQTHTRRILSEQALALGQQLSELAPHPESHGLLALMLLHESRRHTRVNLEADSPEHGEPIALADQDRSRWDPDCIARANLLLQNAWLSGRAGPYTLQAAIASVHAAAPEFSGTRWDLIVGYYDLLLKLMPTAVVAMNRAIAVSMLDGPQAALDLLNDIHASGELHEYHLLYGARADCYRRLDRPAEAIREYDAAIARAKQSAERRYLEKQRNLLAV